MLKRLVLIFFILTFSSQADSLEKCKFDNREGKPCIVISKTPNSSTINANSINKIVITKEDITKANAIDINDVLKLIPGLDVFQSGQKGQQTSIFTRGSESNHTLVLINGIAINDQSTTDGLHDFGQDFVQTIQQIEIYKGSNGAHFGPSAIAGAINFVTAIDYQNSYSIGGFDDKNNSADLNLTKITNNDWHLNLKATSNQSKTNSTIANGNEDDGVQNYQLNLNSKKWINDNLIFNSTLYSRQTMADYDGSASNERGYFSDNKMYVMQSGLNHRTQNSESEFKIHYHNYDREYENGGYLDEYYSESIVLKGERSIRYRENISFGYGSEYKYDWGYFENRGSYNASTKGHMKDFSIFGNTGLKLNKNQILSIYGRIDDHNTTGGNATYKLNFRHDFKKMNIGLTHTTGLRNPSLYELYGSDNFGIVGNTGLNAEKSETNELYSKYYFSEHLIITSSLYRAKIFDRIESNGTYTTFENFKSAINQEGMETELLYRKNNEYISLFVNLSKSRKSNNSHQSRRPDLSYGLNLREKFKFNPIGLVNLNLNYKYTGKYLDWDGSQNSFQKSTDLMNISISKSWLNNNISLNVTNLLNERYERPATYTQDGRKIHLFLKKQY